MKDESRRVERNRLQKTNVHGIQDVGSHRCVRDGERMTGTRARRTSRWHGKEAEPFAGFIQRVGSIGVHQVETGARNRAKTVILTDTSDESRKGSIEFADAKPGSRVRADVPERMVRAIIRQMA